ncbi:MAG: hypothetical protein K9H58_17295 [Bacteroidales bacterium]|nr:hypothetical protein [Bacteroidales bacterium]
MLRPLHIKVFSILFLLLSGLSIVRAQVKVQVVSKTIMETMLWEAGQTLQINAEKADVYCTSSASNSIEIEISFIAKHENREIAETDLRKMKWLSEDLGKKIILRNYIELARDESKPESDIKSIYKIKIPQNCPLLIQNYFGKIKIENISSKLNIESEFSIIDLTGIKGNIYVKTTFGDLVATQIEGGLKVKSNRSDINISDLTGSIDINASVAEIILSDIDNGNAVKIVADKSKIEIKSKVYDRFNFILDLKKADLNTPKDLMLDLLRNDKDEIKSNTVKNSEGVLIDIYLNTGSLSILR